MLRVVAGGLDRIPSASSAQPFMRGRMLILIAGILAAGLIYINVGKLEGGDAYGRYAARSLELQRENTTLRARVAHLSSAERIKQFAKRFGMISPAPEQYKYLHPKRGDALRSVRNYTAPAPAALNSTPTVSPQTSTPLQSGTVPASGTGTPGAAQGVAGTPAPQAPAGTSPAAANGSPGAAGTQGAGATQTGAATTGGGQ
jgi:hypothetical protein